MTNFRQALAAELLIPNTVTNSMPGGASVSFMEGDYWGTNTISNLHGVDNVILHHSAGTITTAIGTNGQVQLLGGGTITNSYGGYFQSFIPLGSTGGNIPRNVGVYAFADNRGTGGAITKNYGVFVDHPIPTAALTHNYGLYIDDQTLGGANNPDPWALYSVAGKVGLGGNLVFPTDNTYDIGAAGANRPRTGYFGTSLNAPTFETSGTGTGLYAVNGSTSGSCTWTTQPISTTSAFDCPVQTAPNTYASLPVCSASTEGSMRAVTDSNTVTWGATVAGGSTNHVLAYCDGTAWTVAGK